MVAYENELRLGDRAALARRYDRRGAWLLSDGGGTFESHAAIAARYAGPGWSPPYRFEWRDVQIEAIGPDAVAVTGAFLWTSEPGQAPMRFSYRAQLIRQDGELRIRLEDERRVRTPN